MTSLKDYMNSLFKSKIKQKMDETFGRPRASVGANELKAKQQIFWNFDI
jgi:hypothetical protein